MQHNKSLLIKNPLIIALDVDTQEKAIDLAIELEDIAGAYKLGPRLIHRYGKDLTLKIAKLAPVFVDCKFFDIPSTMEAAVRASFDSGASLVTVHALAGQEALLRLAKVEKELSEIRPFKILCVTILTSWDQQSLPPVMKAQPISSHVKDLANLVQNAGLTGIVCSPEELDLLQGQGLYLVTPGIRFDLQSAGDQKRTMGPGEAMQKGASALVVGRPIIESSSPKEAAMDFSISILNKK